MKKNKSDLMDSVIIFTVVFVVGMIITFLYNLIIYHTGLVDGETSFRLALTLAVSLGIIRYLSKKKII